MVCGRELTFDKRSAGAEKHKGNHVIEIWQLKGCLSYLLRFPFRYTSIEKNLTHPLCLSSLFHGVRGNWRMAGFKQSTSVVFLYGLSTIISRDPSMPFSLFSSSSPTSPDPISASSSMLSKVRPEIDEPFEEKAWVLESTRCALLFSRHERDWKVWRAWSNLSNRTPRFTIGRAKV